MKKYFKIFLIIIVLSEIFGLSFSQPANNYSRIAVLYSELTDKHNNPNSTKVIDAITAWELFLMQNKIPYKVIYDDDIESGISDGFDVLILPSVAFISPDEFVELQKFLADGKSIICTGSKLCYTNQTNNNYLNLQTLFGLNNIEPVESQRLSFQHSIAPNHLNRFKTDDDLILQISNRNNALQTESSEMNLYPYGFILDVDNLDLKNSSILFGSVGIGKFLWTGFDLADIIGGEDDLSVFKNLIFNSLNWMNNKPDVYLENFPNKLSSPVVLGIQNNNVLNERLIDELHLKNVKAFLLVTPEQNIKQEILSRFDEDEFIFDLSQFSDLTTNRLIELINRYNSDNKIELSTIFVNEELLNKIDLHILKSEGINNILYNSQIPGLPKFSKNDILLIPYSKSNNTFFSANTLNSLYYNPKIDCDKDLDNELLIRTDNIKAEGYNFVPLNSIIKWWKSKERISAQVKSVDESGIEIFLNNQSLDDISGLKLFVNINKNVFGRSFTVTFNNSIVSYQYNEIVNALEISLKSIRSNSVNWIKVNFNIN